MPRLCFQHWPSVHAAYAIKFDLTAIKQRASERAYVCACFYQILLCLRDRSLFSRVSFKNWFKFIYRFSRNNDPHEFNNVNRSSHHGNPKGESKGSLKWEKCCSISNRHAKFSVFIFESVCSYIYLRCVSASASTPSSSSSSHPLCAWARFISSLIFNRNISTVHTLMHTECGPAHNSFSFSIFRFEINTSGLHKTMPCAA